MLTTKITINDVCVMYEVLKSTLDDSPAGSKPLPLRLCCQKRCGCSQSELGNVSCTLSLSFTPLKSEVNIVCVCVCV